MVKSLPKHLSSCAIGSRSITATLLLAWNIVNSGFSISTLFVYLQRQKVTGSYAQGGCKAENK